MENNNPLVSVIMPAFNMEKYIGESIQSVLDQDYRNWELIVMDDGSTDSTASIVKHYAEKDKRIKYYYQSNQKLSRARNNAITKAAGELIAFLDSDDLWLPQKLSVSVKEFLSSDQDLLFTDSYVFYNIEDLKGLPYLNRMVVENAIYKGSKGISEFLKKNRIPVLTVLAKKEVFVENEGFPIIQFAEDYYKWLVLLLNDYKLRSIQQPLSVYRLRKDSMTGSAISIEKNVLYMFMQLSEQYPVIRTDYKQDIKLWFMEIITNSLNKANVADLKKYLIYFGFYNKRVKSLYSFRKLLPFSLFRSFMKSAF